MAGAFNPEAIELALFNLLKTATADFGFEKTSRTYELFGNAGIENQDALYLVPLGPDIDQSQAEGAPRYQLKYIVAVYSFAADDRNAVPQTRLNNALAAIDAALRGKPPGYRQTLGGLVENCWIDGSCPMSYVGKQQMELFVPVTAITGI